MPSEVVHDRLMALVAAFPLTSRQAFDRRLYVLERRQGLLSPLCQTLWMPLADVLRPHAGSLSLESLGRLRDRVWFGSDEPMRLTESIPLAQFVTRLATRYLESCGAQMRLSREQPLPELAAQWRWLSLALPSDLLVAAHAASFGRVPQCDEPTLTGPHVGHVLNDGPVADTHLHVGAAVGFAGLWTGLVVALGARDRRARPQRTRLAAKGPPPFGNSSRWLAWLTIAAIARTLLGAYLWHIELYGPQRFEDVLRTIAARLPRSVSACVSDALEQLIGGAARQRRLRPERLGRAYRSLIGGSWRKLTSLDEVYAADPLSSLPWAKGVALAETAFTARALRQLLHSTRAAQSLWARVFWQYQRIRCMAFRYVTQDPGVMGLDWFSRHSRRIGAMRGAIEPFMAASAVRHQKRGVRLEALELRTRPPLYPTSPLAMVRRVAQESTDLELGLILHFIKRRVYKVAGKEKLFADPHNMAFGSRFGVWYRKRAREAAALARMLRRRPETLLIFRGVDMASTELAVPTWVTLPLIESVRMASEQAAARLAVRRPEWQAKPIGVTYHAGEDYRRLIEGLRRVHELLEFGALRQGDRIGHAISLGDPVGRWRGVTSIVQPREERLDDLLWELERYGQYDIPLDHQRAEQLRHEIAHHCACMYKVEITAEVLERARRLRHCRHTLERIGYPNVSVPNGADAAEQLLCRYLTDRSVFERGREPIEVRGSPQEEQVVEALQRWLRRLVSSAEITVESNPSSNLLIGSYLSLQQHPAFVLQPVNPKPAEAAEGVFVSVNSDDPITFASGLADEYAYLYFAMLRAGVPVSDALAWIERARKNGWRSRFTLAKSRDPVNRACLTQPWASR